MLGGAGGCPGEDTNGCGAYQELLTLAVAAEAGTATGDERRALKEKCAEAQASAQALLLQRPALWGGALGTGQRWRRDRTIVCRPPFQASQNYTRGSGGGVFHPLRFDAAAAAARLAAALASHASPAGGNRVFMHSFSNRPGAEDAYMGAGPGTRVARANTPPAPRPQTRLLPRRPRSAVRLCPLSKPP